MAMFCLVQKCEKADQPWGSLQAIAMHLNRAHGVMAEKRQEGVHYEERPSTSLVPIASTEVEAPKKRRRGRQQEPLTMQEVWTNGHSKIVMVDSDERVWVAKMLD